MSNNKNRLKESKRQIEKSEFMRYLIPSLLAIFGVMVGGLISYFSQIQTQKLNIESQKSLFREQIFQENFKIAREERKTAVEEIYKKMSLIKRNFATQQQNIEYFKDHKNEDIWNKLKEENDILKKLSDEFKEIYDKHSYKFPDKIQLELNVTKTICERLNHYIYSLIDARHLLTLEEQRERIYKLYSTFNSKIDELRDVEKKMSLELRKLLGYELSQE